MSGTRWTTTCAVLLAITSGCSEKKVKLYPVVTKNGFITYVTKDPHDPVAEEQSRTEAARQQLEAEARSLREEQRLQAVADSTRRNNAVRDLQIQSLMRRSAEPKFQPRWRSQPSSQGSNSFLRSGEMESARLQQESQAIDRSLEDLRKGQEAFGARK